MKTIASSAGERRKRFFFKKKAAVINSFYCTGHAQKMMSLLIQDEICYWAMSDLSPSLVLALEFSWLV